MALKNTLTRFYLRFRKRNDGTLSSILPFGDEKTGSTRTIYMFFSVVQKKSGKNVHFERIRTERISSVLNESYATKSGRDRLHTVKPSPEGDRLDFESAEQVN